MSPILKFALFFPCMTISNIFNSDSNYLELESGVGSKSETLTRLIELVFENMSCSLTCDATFGSGGRSAGLLGPWKALATSREYGVSRLTPMAVAG